MLKDYQHDAVPSAGTAEFERLDNEVGRARALVWYRSPSRASQNSHDLAYWDATDASRTIRPDFMYFDRVGVGVDVRVSIIDPHGHDLTDALVRLRGLAAFAAACETEFQRVEAIAKTGDRTPVLYLGDPQVRAAINAADGAIGLRESQVAGSF